MEIRIKSDGNAMKNTENVGLSYTLSFTPHHQCIKAISVDGCRNVGEKQKNFFLG